MPADFLLGTLSLVASSSPHAHSFLSHNAITQFLLVAAHKHLVSQRRGKGGGNAVGRLGNKYSDINRFKDEADNRGFHETHPGYDDVAQTFGDVLSNQIGS